MSRMYFVILRSESGDIYPPLLFKDKPTEAQLKEATSHERIECDGWGSPEGPGPGIFDSWLHIDKEGWTQ